MRVHACVRVSLFLLHIRLVMVGLVQEIGGIVRIKSWVTYYGYESPHRDRNVCVSS